MKMKTLFVLRATKDFCLARHFSVTGHKIKDTSDTPEVRDSLNGEEEPVDSYLLNEEEKEAKVMRYNSILAQNIKMKRLEKSDKRASTCRNALNDYEEEPNAGENYSSEQQQLEFDLEGEDYLTLNHDVDDVDELVQEQQTTATTATINANAH
jgi:hypothetical protein